jgi:hypothetical protein
MVKKDVFIDSLINQKENNFKVYIEELLPLRTFLVNNTEANEICWFGGKIDAKREEGIDAKIKTKNGECKNIQIVFASCSA